MMSLYFVRLSGTVHCAGIAGCQFLFSEATPCYFSRPLLSDHPSL